MFWHAGYGGSSLDDLSAATGMNRPSLYAVFGDKHALYLQTLDRYVEASRRKMDQALAADLPLALACRRYACVAGGDCGCGGGQTDLRQGG
ncbi:MAG: hypothetical protein NVS3B11_19900 [Collimonas sp.]